MRETDDVRELTETLEQCRRYLTDFGSVEPSGLVHRIDAALTAHRRARDERCYESQLETINASRDRDGLRRLTMAEFMSGTAGEDE